jgi:Uma2 family endonuclease
LPGDARDDAARETETGVAIEEFERWPKEDAYHVELVRGMIVREPRPGALHGRITAILTQHLGVWADSTGLGIVLNDMGFVTENDPPSVRGPDVAYVSHGRMPGTGYADGFWRFGPDLAVEVLSPSNRPKEIQEKVREYLAVGSRLVWVVDPRRRIVTVYDAAGGSHTIDKDGALSGDDVLPGFTLPLSRVFAF